MTKMALGAHPFLLGFDRLERLVERTAKSDAGGYPPYNIEQVSERAYCISLAVAGFAEDDLSITEENRQLVVRGRQQEAMSCLMQSGDPLPHGTPKMDIDAALEACPSRL